MNKNLQDICVVVSLCSTRFSWEVKLWNQWLEMVYKPGVSNEKRGKLHMDDWYIQYLKKLGVDVEVKLEDDILEDEEDKE